MARAMKDSGIPWIGEIPEEWEIIKNKYLLVGMYSGGTPTASNEAFYSDNGTPFVSIADMSTTDYVISTKKHVSADGIKDKNLVVLPKGTILYSIYATIGAVSELAINATINQAILALMLKPGINKRYYKYNLAAMRDYVFYNANGNTQSNLNAEKVWNFTFVKPPYIIQNSIVNHLDAECARIDAVIEKTRSSIEEYKRLKQAAITQAVTKGIRPNRPMKDSGIEWIGEVPADWEVYRIANLYDERNESGNDDLPILTISINSGISDHEVDDEEQARVFVRSEDRTKYKRVYPGDLAYNMMRAWQGAFGAVRVDGMISPAYVVAQPKSLSVLDSRYVEALLRTPSAIEEMHRYSHGITDFRLRLYWPEFKNIRICVPSSKEQKEIADYIDTKSKEIYDLLLKKEQFIQELSLFKQSSVYEYVTGKKKVTT